MASLLCVLYYVYKTGIVASNVYSFVAFSKVMYPYVKDFGDRIPYDDIETVKHKIIQTYYDKVQPSLSDKMRLVDKIPKSLCQIGQKTNPFTFPSNFKFTSSDIDDSWIDLKTHECVPVTICPNEGE